MRVNTKNIYIYFFGLVLVIFCFSGGLSNWLYIVRLEKGVASPKQVLLRLYGQTHGEDALESLITESVIFTLLSERKLGPKLYGVFPGGRIEEFLQVKYKNLTYTFLSK